MIEPGLGRISKLVKKTPFDWRAIHVAGTNGKGSICASISAGLHAARVENDEEGGYGRRIRSGRFTSPHLVDRWDCIQINESVIPKSLFDEIEARITRRDIDQGVGATEFERLTATAFEIFTDQGVDVAVVETGMGGRLDATNVLTNPLVTVIAKIGLDHRSFLGHSLEEIAAHKAGIMKKGVPCVVDGTNDDRVLAVLREYAQRIGAGPCVPVCIPRGDNGTSIEGEEGDVIWKYLRAGEEGEDKDIEPHQWVNRFCAAVATRIALERMSSSHTTATTTATTTTTEKPWDWKRIVSAVKQARMPGRLQWLNTEQLTGRREDILLDGAHNGQSAEVLASYVHRRLGQSSAASFAPSSTAFTAARSWSVAAASRRTVTWLIAASQGKDLEEIFTPLIQSGDRVVTVEFGPVDGMPWVHPVPASELAQSIISIMREKKKKMMMKRYDHDDDRNAAVATSHTSAGSSNDNGGGDGDDNVEMDDSGDGGDDDDETKSGGEPITIVRESGSNLLGALHLAVHLAAQGPLVVAGSLYLVGDLLRLLQSSSTTTNTTTATTSS